MAWFISCMQYATWIFYTFWPANTQASHAVNNSNGCIVLSHFHFLVESDWAPGDVSSRGRKMLFSVKDTFHFYSQFIRFARGHNFHRLSISKKNGFCFTQHLVQFSSCWYARSGDMKNKMKIYHEKYLCQANLALACDTSLSVLSWASIWMEFTGPLQMRSIGLWWLKYLTWHFRHRPY